MFSKAISGSVTLQLKFSIADTNFILTIIYFVFVFLLLTVLCLFHNTVLLSLLRVIYSTTVTSRLLMVLTLQNSPAGFAE